MANEVVDGLVKCPKCGLPKPTTVMQYKTGDTGHGYGWCRDCMNKRNYAWSRTAHGRFVYAKSLAARRKLAWDIAEAAYEVMLAAQCHYCLGPLNETGVGLDRMDNDLGYIQTNVVSCCDLCNAIKSNHLSYAEMMVLAPSLCVIRKARTSSGD